MVTREIRQVALMSIKPRYAMQILNGEKTVEFRRTRLRIDTTHVVVYATAPIGLIVGAFEIAGIDEASPFALWRRYRLNGGINYNGFMSYFECARQGIAIRIGQVYALPDPALLAELTTVQRPPQSYCYLPDNVLVAIQERTNMICATG